MDLFSREHADKTGCRVHAYVLMTNHVHLLISAKRTEAPGTLMKALGQRYVQYVNRTYRRSGTVWEGRFRSCLTQEETYLLACQRYIELNPVRADMVAHPAEYRWSSYRANAQGEADALLKSHPLYDALGADAASRQAAQRKSRWLWGGVRHPENRGDPIGCRSPNRGNCLVNRENRGLSPVFAVCPLFSQHVSRAFY